LKRAIVVGTGAGGATVAKALQGAFSVTILEAGKEFKPFAMNLSVLDKLRMTGLFLDEREIPFLFPTMRIRKADRDFILVNGRGTGGTTTIATGNALRMDQSLRALGLDLDEEFSEIADEIPISTEHQKRWHPVTRRLYEICQHMGLNPRPTPKMGDYSRCIRCGRCIFGCQQGAKWDTREFVGDAVKNGAELVTECAVDKVIVSDGLAIGVEARKGWSRKFYHADLVVLAAGGFGTPVILQNSGIECEKRLFVDPILCVAAPSKRSMHHTEVAMPFLVQRDHFIVSPYFDYLSFFFHPDWRYPMEDLVGLMIKLADTPAGRVSKKGVEKGLTVADQNRLKEATDLCSNILREFGASSEEIFLGTVNAGHPGGMLPLTTREAASLHHPSLPYNLYVADATLLPESLGNPPILTIIALAKRISKLCVRLFASQSLN
jgi:choline dehydrogenase-like flavoprotein